MFLLTRLLKCFKGTFSNSHMSSEVQFYLSKKKRTKRRKKRKNILKVSKITYFKYGRFLEMPQKACEGYIEMP